MTPMPPPTARPFPPTSLDGWEPKYSTAGTQLNLVESNRTQGTGTTVIRFQLATAGLAKDKSYELWAFSLSVGEPRHLGQVNLDANGIVRTGLNIGGFSKGEALRMALVTTNQETVVFGKAVPFPIEAKGTGGCSLFVELLSPKGDSFWISGAGFAPNEELTWVSRSAQEEMTGKFKADGQGGFLVFMLPAVVGQESGDASYTARGGTCQVSVDYKWGRAALGGN